MDPSRLYLYGLDPAEDVDESNWLGKGHFRQPRRLTPEGSRTKVTRNQEIMREREIFRLDENF